MAGSMLFDGRVPGTAPQKPKAAWPVYVRPGAAAGHLLLPELSELAAHSTGGAERLRGEKGEMVFSAIRGVSGVPPIRFNSGFFRFFVVLEVGFPHFTHKE